MGGAGLAEPKGGERWLSGSIDKRESEQEQTRHSNQEHAWSALTSDRTWPRTTWRASGPQHRLYTPLELSIMEGA